MNAFCKALFHITMLSDTTIICFDLVPSTYTYVSIHHHHSTKLLIYEHSFIL